MTSVCLIEFLIYGNLACSHKNMNADICSCEKPGIDGILRPAFGSISPHILTELYGYMGTWL